MTAIVDSLSAAAEFRTADRVQTLRGRAHGTVVRMLIDGRLAWLPDGASADLLTLPESLRPA